MGSINIAYGSTGTVTHKNEDIVWGGIYDLEHQTWTITTEADFDLDPVKYYWVYIKSNVDDGTALWYLSESKIQALDVEGYYMFEWGQINPVREGSRILQPAYGSSYKMHNPVTVAVGSAAFASIDANTQVLTVNEQSGGASYFPDTITSETGNVQSNGKHTHKVENIDISSVVETNGYGALYNQKAATDSRSISSSDDFILPDNIIFEELFVFAGSIYDAMESNWPTIGGKLKETGSVHWNLPNEGATNEYGFNAIGSGQRSGDWGGFETVIKEFLGIWSSTFITPTEGSDLRAGHGVVYIENWVSSLMLTTALYTDGYSIRLCNPTTLLSEGEYGSYTDNVGGTYITKVINGVEWMLSNLNDKKFRNGDWIEGFNGGVYTPISNEDWETRGTAGESLMCYYDDNEAYGGGQIPLVDLLISEHNSLNGLDGGDPDNNFFGHLTEAELAKVQALGSTFQVHIKFEAVEAFTYTCPYALKFTAMIHQQTNAPTLSVALDTNMAQYDDLVITPDATGLVTLTGEWL